MYVCVFYKCCKFVGNKYTTTTTVEQIIKLPVISDTMTFTVTPLMSQVAPLIYRKTSNISHTLAGNKLFDHQDVVGASLVGIAQPTSLFSI